MIFIKPVQIQEGAVTRYWGCLDVIRQDTDRLCSIFYILQFQKGETSNNRVPLLHVLLH